MMAESILHSSARRWEVNSASIRKPPEHGQHIGVVADDERARLVLTTGTACPAVLGDERARCHLDATAARHPRILWSPVGEPPPLRAV
jgi:hypothetical protein